MARLRHRLRTRAADSAAAVDYRWARTVIGDTPTTDQRFWLLSQALGWDEITVARKLQREAAGAKTAPLVDRLLAEAQRRWPVDETPASGQRFTMVGRPRVARDSTEAIASGHFMRIAPMNPADEGFRFVNLPGHAVGVRVREGGGPPLVFIPGKGATATNYTGYLFDYLPAAETVDEQLLEHLGPDASRYLERVEALGRRSVVTLDFPGRGYSDPFPDLERPRTWFDYADVVHQVLENLGIDEQPIILGHSMGGPIALAYHARYGAAGLQLFDGSHLGLVLHRPPPPRKYLSEPGRKDLLAGEFFDTYRDQHDDATLLDLKRGADLLASASYSQIPGVSFRKNPLGWWDAPEASYVLDWRYQGLEMANRLGMVCVTGGDHNPHWTLPELTRFGLLALDDAVLSGGSGPVALDPAVVQLLNGTIENPAIMRKEFTTETVTLAGVTRFTEDSLLPLLPERLPDREEGIDRLARLSPWNLRWPRPHTPTRLVDTEWPHGLLAQIPRMRLVGMASPKGFPGADRPVPMEVFPRIQGPGPEALRAIRSAAAAPVPPGASRSFTPGCPGHA